MKPEPELQARLFPARAGIAWLRQSFTLLRAQSGRLFLMVVLLQFIMGLTQIPFIGFFLVISVPALSAGILQAFQVTFEGGRPPLFLLFQPLSSGARSRRLLILGILMFAVGVLTVALLLPQTNAMLDPELLSRIEQGDIEALSSLDQDSLRRMVLAFLVGIGVSGTLSYMTIPLIWFHNRPLGSALVSGLRALFVNWKAFLVLALGMMALLLPVSLVAGILFALAESAGAFSVLVMALVMILVLAFQLMLFGTQFCAFRDIFGVDTTPVETQPPDESQLLA